METRKFRTLSDKERFTFETIIQFTDGKVSFALIGDTAAITLGYVSPSDNEEVLRAKTKAAISATLLAEDLPVDEGILTNRFGFITIGRAAVISHKMLSAEELAEGTLKGWRRFGMKANLRKQCEMFELIAVAFAD